MRITEITFEKNKNLGNYESEKISLTAVIEEGSDPRLCIATLKDEVNAALGLAPAPVKAEPAKVVPAKVVKKPAPVKPVEVKAEVVDVVEVVVEPVKKAPVKKAVKMVPYNREEASHKTEFAKVLAGINANWKTECAALCKGASVELAGVDMLDEKGKVLPAFIEQVKAIITATDL